MILNNNFRIQSKKVVFVTPISMKGSVGTAPLGLWCSGSWSISSILRPATPWGCWRRMCGSAVRLREEPCLVTQMPIPRLVKQERQYRHHESLIICIKWWHELWQDKEFCLSLLPVLGSNWTELSFYQRAALNLTEVAMVTSPMSTSHHSIHKHKYHLFKKKTINIHFCMDDIIFI